MLAPWKKSYGQPRQHIKKQRHCFAKKSLSSQSYGFSSSHVWMWELDYKESWAPKNWCFWTVVLEKKTLESPLDCKEIKPVNSEGNQSWIFIGRTDAEAETSIFWSLDINNWLIVTDRDARKYWRQEEKGMQRMRWSDGIINSMNLSLSKLWELVIGKPGVLQSMGLQRVGMTEWLNWTESLHLKCWGDSWLPRASADPSSGVLTQVGNRLGLKLVIFQGPTLNFNLLNQEIGTCPNLCRIVSLDRGLDHDPTIFHADLLGLCRSALLTIPSLVEAACLFISSPTPTPTRIQPSRDWASVSEGRSWLSTAMAVHGRLSGNTVSSRCESFCHMASYICSSLRGLNVLSWHLPPQTLSVLSPVEVSPTPGSLIKASLLSGPSSFQHPMLLKSPLTWRQAHLRHERSPHINEFPVFQSLAIFQQDTILKC